MGRMGGRELPVPCRSDHHGRSGLKNQTCKVASCNPRSVHSSSFFVQGEGEQASEGASGSTFHLSDSPHSNHNPASHGVSRVAAAQSHHVSSRLTASPIQSGRLLPKSVRHDRLKHFLSMGCVGKPCTNPDPSPPPLKHSRPLRIGTARLHSRAVQWKDHPEWASPPVLRS